MTQPTPLDIENARRRQEIADKFRREFEEAQALAEQVLGPGWEPHGRHDIIENEEADAARAQDRKPVPVATVISARKGPEERHFIVTEGVATECGRYDESFAKMLEEMHPTKSIFKHQVHWSGFEKGYAPRSAESLAKARTKRQERAVEKEADGSLFADVIREEGYVPKRRAR